MRCPSIDKLKFNFNISDDVADGIRALAKSVDSPTNRENFSMWLAEYVPSILASAQEQTPNPLEYNTSRQRLMMETFSILLNGHGRETLVTKTGSIVFVNMGNNNDLTLLYVVGRGTIEIARPTDYI